MKKSDKKKVSLWERYLTKEIGIEFKACLYFFGVLFYYCTYRLCIGVTVAEILHMAEMIFLTYAVTTNFLKRSKSACCSSAFNAVPSAS